MKRETKPLPVDWRDLMNQDRKALTLKDLPANIRRIFKKRRRRE